ESSGMTVHKVLAEATSGPTHVTDLPPALPRYCVSSAALLAALLARARRGACAADRGRAGDAARVPLGGHVGGLGELGVVAVGGFSRRRRRDDRGAAPGNRSRRRGGGTCGRRLGCGAGGRALTGVAALDEGAVLRLALLRPDEQRGRHEDRR